MHLPREVTEDRREKDLGLVLPKVGKKKGGKKRPNPNPLVDSLLSPEETERVEPEATSARHHYSKHAQGGGYRCSPALSTSPDLSFCEGWTSPTKRRSSVAHRNCKKTVPAHRVPILVYPSLLLFVATPHSGRGLLLVFNSLSKEKLLLVMGLGLKSFDNH